MRSFSFSSAISASFCWTACSRAFASRPADVLDHGDGAALDVLDLVLELLALRPLLVEGPVELLDLLEERLGVELVALHPVEEVGEPPDDRLLPLEDLRGGGRGRRGPDPGRFGLGHLGTRGRRGGRGYGRGNGSARGQPTVRDVGRLDPRLHRVVVAVDPLAEDVGGALPGWAPHAVGRGRRSGRSRSSGPSSGSSASFVARDGATGSEGPRIRSDLGRFRRRARRGRPARAGGPRRPSRGPRPPDAGPSAPGSRACGPSPRPFPGPLARARSPLRLARRSWNWHRSSSSWGYNSSDGRGSPPRGDRTVRARPAIDRVRSGQRAAPQLGHPVLPLVGEGAAVPDTGS